MCLFSLKFENATDFCKTTCFGKSQFFSFDLKVFSAKQIAKLFEIQYHKNNKDGSASWLKPTEYGFIIDGFWDSLQVSLEGKLVLYELKT